MALSLNSVTELGAAIRDRRRALGFSQRELADRVGVSRQWVVGVEAGRSRTEVGLLLRTLKALDLALLLDDGSASSADPGGGAVLGADIDALIERTRGTK